MDGSVLCRIKLPQPTCGRYQVSVNLSSNIFYKWATSGEVQLWNLCVPLLLVNWKIRHPCYLPSAGNGNRYKVSFAQDGKNKLPPASISATFSSAQKPPSSSQPAMHCLIAHTEQTNHSSPLLPLNLLISSNFSLLPSLPFLSLSFCSIWRLTAITQSIYHTNPHHRNSL